MLPDVVKNLLIINALFFLATLVAGSNFQFDLSELLGLHYFESKYFYPFQYISYMFMHGDVGHIFFNMFALWMFGSMLENRWGSKNFLIFYMVTGIGAGIINNLVSFVELQYISDSIPREVIDAFKHQGKNIIGQSFPATQDQLQNLYFIFSGGTVGASGAIYGLFVAFAMIYPNMKLYLMFIPIPIKAKYLVIGMVIYDLAAGLQPFYSTGIAHFAHLGGGLIGFLLLTYWKRKGEVF
ncbi:MAG: rhomboid family intramembrane serine protease [Bacteroidia bacterium]|nr:rhomboid family intramembrane serine protease [Bacteroidia bacterium]NNC86101.1 rhomboid family intramembrane serine protease [Bacteroidia bacterium]NNM15470.1 rhomboid family intramembrane serine protease [Bacteroidia bacterium]